MSDFSLREEQICIEKWKQWFDAGGWLVLNMTQAKSAKFQIPKILDILHNSDDRYALSNALYNFVNGLEFKHDGIATRGRFSFNFDYKYHQRTPYGNWIKKADYDKYYSWNLPLFYILSWAEDKQKRFMHQLRDPAIYKAEPVGAEGIAYYKIPDSDWVEPDAMFDKQFTVPESMSELDSKAFIFAVNDWVKSGYHGRPVITKDNRAQARMQYASKAENYIRILRRSIKISAGRTD